MPAKTRRTYAGAATSTTITASINSTDTTISLTAATGWAAGPFYAVIDPGTASEEKIYVSSRSTTTLTVGTRGVDGTTAKSHASGAIIYPVHTAVDSDEANELTSKYTSRGDIVYQGASTFTRLGVGTADQVLKTNGTDPSWGQVATAGIADDAVTAAKIATGAVGTTELADSSVTSAKIAANAVALGTATTGNYMSGVSSGTGISVSHTPGEGSTATVSLNASLDNLTDVVVTTPSNGQVIKYNGTNWVNGTDSSGGIPDDNSVSTAKIVDGAVTSAKIADGTIVNGDVSASAAIAYSKLSLSNSIVAGDITSSAVTTAKIADANVTNAKLNNGSSGDIPLVTVSTSDPTGGKNGDIWVKVV
jgi:hypothetical protein